MGNPASDKRKLTEKRRKRHEDRLGPGAYLPKAEREKLNAAIKVIEADEAVKKAARKAEKAKKAAEAKAAAAKPEEPKA